jgi:hypothetical protein
MRSGPGPPGRAVAQALIAVGMSQLIYEDEMWHGAWDLDRATDDELAAWGVRLVVEVRAEILAS